MHARLNHPCIVKHHQRALRQIVGQMAEHTLPYLTFIIYKEFRLVATGFRELGNALVGQFILIVADADMSRIGHTVYSLRFTEWHG